MALLVSRRAGIYPSSCRKSPLTAAALSHHQRTLQYPAAAEWRQAQQQHMLVPQSQLQQQQKQKQQQQRLLVCSRASSSNSSSPQQPQGGGILSFFDRLPPRVQLGIMGALLFIGMFVIPFLQPTFIYGDTSKTAQQQTITNVKEGSASSEPQLYKLPRYIPGASELYDFLQENSMPRKLPDGRTESPGVMRIYLSSLIILAAFYVCSAAVALILRSVAAILRAVGIAGPPKPQE